MDNGATSSGQGGGARAGTKAPPPTGPTVPDSTTAEAVVSTEGSGNGNGANTTAAGNGKSTGNGASPANGKRNAGNGSTRGNGRGRAKRPPAPTAGVIGDPLAAASPVEPTPDAASTPDIPAAPDQPVPGATNGDDTGPYTRGRPLGRFLGRGKSPAPAVPVAAAATAAAAVATPAPPPVAPPLASPPPAPPPAGTPVVTRVLDSPPTAPVMPVVPIAPMPIVAPPADPSGGLVARKVTVPPMVVAPIDVPLEPEPTITVPLGRRPGRPAVTFQRRRTRPRVRRVTRVVRHVDTWSVFKVALVFSAFLYAVALTAGVLLWHVATATGTIDNVERFFEGFGWESFRFKGGEIFHNAWIAGLFVAVGLTGLAVLLATLFNLITDLVGGVRISVLEEEVLARRDRTARMVVEDDPDTDAPYDQARHG